MALRILRMQWVLRLFDGPARLCVLLSLSYGTARMRVVLRFYLLRTPGLSVVLRLLRRAVVYIGAEII